MRSHITSVPTYTIPQTRQINDVTFLWVDVDLHAEVTMVTESIALLESLIDAARDEREKIDDEVAVIEDQLKTLRKKRTALHDEEVVLTSVLFRQTAGTGAAPISNDVDGSPVDPGDGDWSQEGRSEAVEKAVVEITAAKGFATPAEVEELLRKRNRTGDTRDYIGASLAYLRKSDKAHTRARAEWVSGPE